jgi:hypothetical protein
VQQVGDLIDEGFPPDLLSCLSEEFGLYDRDRQLIGYQLDKLKLLFVKRSWLRVMRDQEAPEMILVKNWHYKGREYSHCREVLYMTGIDRALEDITDWLQAEFFQHQLSG